MLLCYHVLTHSTPSNKLTHRGLASPADTQYTPPVYYLAYPDAGEGPPGRALAATPCGYGGWGTPGGPSPLSWEAVLTNRTGHTNRTE